MVAVGAMTTSKSPLRVLLTALDVGKSALRPYAHRFSPKKFTQPQLFACLVLKEFLKLDYRGLSMLLKDAPDLCYWRRQMKARLHLTRYGQRWQAETVNSMLKRLLGSALRARSYWSQYREMLLMAITLNVMILAVLWWIIMLFYRAAASPFPPRSSALPFICPGWR